MNCLYFTPLQSELKNYEQPKGISIIPWRTRVTLTYCWIFSISSASNSAAVLQVTGLERCFVRSTGVLGCVGPAFTGFFETEPTNSSHRNQQLMARPATITGHLLRVVKASLALDTARTTHLPQISCSSNGNEGVCVFGMLLPAQQRTHILLWLLHVFFCFPGTDWKVWGQCAPLAFAPGDRKPQSVWPGGFDDISFPHWRTVSVPSSHCKEDNTSH